MRYGHPTIPARSVPNYNHVIFMVSLFWEAGKRYKFMVILTKYVPPSSEITLDLLSDASNLATS